MCYIVTMHMGKATRIFRDDATGCLKCEFEFLYTSVFPYSAVYTHLHISQFVVNFVLISLFYACNVTES